MLPERGGQVVSRAGLSYRPTGEREASHAGDNAIFPAGVTDTEALHLSNLGPWHEPVSEECPDPEPFLIRSPHKDCEGDPPDKPCIDEQDDANGHQEHR